MKRENNIEVLLVEDELTLAMIIKDTLEEHSFVIHTASDGEEGLRLFFELRPDIVVADVMMPRMDGFTLVKRIRQTDTHTPVLFLTARSAIQDIVEGFETGANDYLKKPFGMQELIVRIKSLLGRALVREETEKQNLLEIGRYRLDPTTQLLIFGDQQTELSHREAEILKRLCENREKIVRAQDILLDLWGDDNFFNNRSLHVFITKIRHKLAKDPDIRILNVRGIGYKLIVHSTT
ncbi:MAG: response regulator transcription factor [Bacteroides sp.]|nr:response regulator transcription factor [Bacteroides sp.]